MVDIIEVTDAPNNFGTPYSISIGERFLGTITSRSDADAVQTNLELGFGYYAVMTADGSPGSLTKNRLFLIDETGAEVDGTGFFGSTTAVVSTSPTADGRFFLRGDGDGGATGNYQIELFQEVSNNQFTTNSSLNVGETIQSAIDYNGDVDQFKVYLERGFGYYAVMSGDGGPVSLTSNRLTISDRFGEALLDISGGSSTVLPATPTSSNTFYLAADTSSSATGSYKISLLREVANGFTTNANAPVGVIQSGVFEYSNDVDVYRTFLENGATYKISLEGNGSKDSISGGGIQVFASDGAQVASKVSFVDSTLEFSAPKNGEYFVAFSSNGSGENYNFRVDLSGVNGKTINGTSGNDTLRGSSGEDRFDAGKGDDFVILGDADDNARGGYGNDTIYAGAGDTGNDYLEGNAGNDILGAGAGNDMIDGGDGNDVIFGGAGNDKAEGGSGSDTIWAGTEDDSVLGEDGNDILGGGEGVDTVGGGIGNDVIYGASGIDMISGGGGDDTVFGGAGNDRITGDEGNDALYGGAGNDVFVFASGHGQDSIGGFKTKGDNTIDLTALGLSGFSDLTVTQSGSDVLISTGQGAITLWSTIVAELGAEDFLF